MQEAPATITDRRCTFDVDITRDRPDGQAVIRVDVIQFLHRIDVDENRGTGEAKPHRWNEALSPGQHACVGSMLL